MARGIIENRKYPFIKIFLITGFISAVYFLSGFLLASDTGPMWTFYVYFPIEMTAMAVGFGGGSEAHFYKLIFAEFMVLWMLLLMLFLTIRIIVLLIRQFSK
jgi:hypothetical protein